VKVAVLFSGGKDSALALYHAMKAVDVACLITVDSGNTESYMFHTPNISLTRMQADSIGLPHILRHSEGIKERELCDLEAAIKDAVKEFGIEGVVSGAIESVYQGQRLQRICDNLGLWCFNPLWKMDQGRLLEEVVSLGFEVIVSGVFAYPLDDSWLGRRLDRQAVRELSGLSDSFGISPSGEGGEIETTVLFAPFFSRRIGVVKARTEYRNNSGVYIIEEAAFEDDIDC
jgi:diphthine-ammonia ligase